jgi:hypothetical protein
MKGLRLIRLLAVVLVVLSALLAIALAVLASIDLSAYRGPLEARVSHALRRQIVLNGPIRIEPSLWPTVTAQDVAIANADWASKPRLAEADGLSLQFRLLSLLWGRFDIQRVILVGGRLHLETRPDGTPNWLETQALAAPELPAAEPPSAQLTGLPQIEVRRSQVDFRDGHSGVVTHVRVLAAVLSAEPGRPLELAFDGTLRGQPLTVGVAGGSLGELVRGETPWPVRIALVIGSAQVNARGELQHLPDPRFVLQVHANGTTFDALSALAGVRLPPLGPFELDAELIRDGTGYEVNRGRGFLGPEGSKRRFTVSAASLAAPFAEPVKVHAVGTFRNMPFELQLDGDPYPRLLVGAADWPLQAALQIAHTRLAVDGTVQPASGDFSVQVQANGADLSTLEPLLGRELPALGPYEVRTRMHRAAQVVTLQELSARVGRSDVQGELRVTLGEARPHVAGRLASNTMDLDDLRGALATAPPERSPGGPPLSLTQTLLPSEDLQVLDAELALSIGRVLGAGARIEQLRSRLGLRQGQLALDGLQVRLAGEPLTGSIAYGNKDGEPTVRLDAHGRAINYGPVLATLHITDRLSGYAQQLDFSLRGQGRTLDAIWQSAALGLEARGGTFTHTRLRDGRTFSFTIEQGRATSGGGAGLEMTLQGRYLEQPYVLELRGDGIRELEDDTRPWHVNAAGTLAGVDFGAEGLMRAVFEGEGVNLQVRLAGKHLAALNPVLGHELPALGVFRLAGRLTDLPGGIQIKDLDAAIGESDFTGEARYTSGETPRIETRLTSRLLRLADLDETPEPSAAQTPAQRLLPEQPFPLQTLRALELELNYRAERVALTRSELRNVSFQVQLRQGRLQVRSIAGRVWQGTLSGSLELDGSLTPPRASLSLAVKDFEFADAFGALGAVGISGVRGLVALDLHGEGAGLRETLGSAKGVAEFYGTTGRIDNRFLSWWGSDLFVAMLPELGKQKAAEVKCTVGHFDVSDGQVETKSLLVDLDRLSIKGAGTVDLKTERIDLLLWPESRDRSLVSVSTPVRVTGTLADPNVAPQASSIVESVVWILLGANNPPVLLLGWLGSGAADGNACGIATDGTNGRSPPQEYSPPTPISKFKDFFRGLGRSITRPFGGD